MSDIQKRMQLFLDGVVASGRERGVQLAVYKDGEMVVDAWAGEADAETGRKVNGETLFPVFSVGKGITATIAHRLVERGVLDYETRIASVWPEFGAKGKRGITLRHALSHATGLQNIPLGVKPEDLADWGRMCRAMAEATPEWPAGSRMVYHAVTFSWVVGETLCRAAGKTFGELMREEIWEAAGIRDIYFGIPDEVEGRVAILEEIFAEAPAAVDDTVARDVPGWLQPLHVWMNRPEARRVCVPASNGIATARDLARHYAMLTPAGLGGRHLLTAERVEIARKLQEPTPKQDPPMGMSLGYFVDAATSAHPAGFGHGGYGGAHGYADPANNLALGLTKNLYSAKGAHSEIVDEVRRALGVPV